MEEQDKEYWIARKRVRQKKRFFNHLKSYVIVNIVFSILTFMEGDGGDFLPVTLLWGMGLAFHYIKVFGIPGTNILTPEWEEEEIGKEMERLRRQKRPEQRPQLPPAEEEPMELKELRKNYDEKDLV